MLRAVLMAAVLLLLLPAVMGAPVVAHAVSGGSVAKTDKWKGTATATCKCDDGQRKVITCEVKGAVS
jgi:hypothetical protein